MKTALVRTQENNLKIIRDDDYRTNDEMAMDLRGNGFKVLKVWNSDVSDIDVDNWEFMNRR